MIFLILWIQSWDLWSKYQFVDCGGIIRFRLYSQYWVVNWVTISPHGRGWGLISPYRSSPTEYDNDNGLLMWFVSYHSLMPTWKYSIVFFHHNWLLSIAAGTIHISGAHGQHVLCRLRGDGTADARLQSYGAWKKISDCRKQWLGLIKCLRSQALEPH
jgi:hypothetical protein